MYFFCEIIRQTIKLLIFCQILSEMNMETLKTLSKRMEVTRGWKSRPLSALTRKVFTVLDIQYLEPYQIEANMFDDLNRNTTVDVT